MQWLYGGLLFGGILVLLVGIAMQLIIGGNSIGIAALIFIPTRVASTFMRAFLPHSILGEPPDRKIAIIWLAIWMGIFFVALKVALT